jgi:hypothetical protein
MGVSSGVGSGVGRGRFVITGTVACLLPLARGVPLDGEMEFGMNVGS